jgi:uncharacterized OB-fold protein
MEKAKTENKRMMSCKDCGNSISKKAEVCPHCGVRHNTHPVVLYNACFFVIGLFIAFFVYASHR